MSPEGIHVCVTGKLWHFRGRTAFEHALREASGNFLDATVKRTTDVLVTNYPDDDTAKNVKAREYGTLVMTEDEFMEHFHIMPLTTEGNR